MNQLLEWFSDRSLQCNRRDYSYLELNLISIQMTKEKKIHQIEVIRSK